MTKHRELYIGAFVALVIASAGLAGKVTLPHVFSPNTTAKASEVNANFEALSVASNDHDTRLERLEGAAVWIDLSFGPEWTNFGGDYQTAQFYKDGRGFVFLRGLVKHPVAGTKTTIATLPAGYRPLKRQLFSMTSAGGVPLRIDILAEGQIEFLASNPIELVQLNGLVFNIQ